MATYIKCPQSDCFQNRCGVRCDLLTGYPSYPCAFYKTEEQVERERIQAHNKLLKEGRVDLIQKYEYNPQRRNLW